MKISGKKEDKQFENSTFVKKKISKSKNVHGLDLDLVYSELISTSYAFEKVYYIWVLPGRGPGPPTLSSQSSPSSLASSWTRPHGSCRSWMLPGYLSTHWSPRSLNNHGTSYILLPRYDFLDNLLNWRKKYFLKENQ